MSDNDKMLLVVLSKVSEIAERSARMEAKLEAVEKDVSFIKQEDKTQNDLLAEHILGVKTNMARLELEVQARKDLESKVERFDNRISKLEETPKFFKNFKKYIVYIVIVGGALATILKWLSHVYSP